MNKLQSVRYEAAYSQLAQKLDMHIKNFDSDPNTQVRWVWELIQNAKDAPNIFKQTKIKQQLDDFYFISSHNGDAFQISQLHSVVAQYSTKKQKNSELTKTTGKYGTGFITTYILSKIIDLQGILKVEIDNDSDNENENGDHSSSDQNSDDQQSNKRTLFRKISSQTQKPSKYKNNEKLHRLIRSQIKSKSFNDKFAKKMKSSNIKKKKRSRDLEKIRNNLIFEKEMEKLMIEEQIQYEEEMKLLQSELGSLSTDDNEFKNFEIRTNFKQREHISKSKKQKTSYYYKKFLIPMDRSYTDRDEQLPKKIQKTQKRLTKIVLQAEYESTKNPDFATGNYYLKQRTVDSYDTTFRYKLVDKKKFEMIERTLANVKELIPYAFLFNDTLNYYEFIDRRKGTNGNLSFSMTKGDIIEIGTNIFLFTFQVQEEYSQEQQKFKSARVEYFVTYFTQGKAIAAIPVHIESNCIQILQINPKLPKFFKDFPLIGCSDHKWNAFINSREFYPNEKRSQLMLKAYDETNMNKVQTNWEKLYACFNAVKEIYVFLSRSHNCKAGLENLMILNSENMLTQENIEFKVYLQKLVRQISMTKIIPNRIKQAGFEQSRTTPKTLFFIEMAYKNDQIYNKTIKQQYEISYQANEVFSFLFGEHSTIQSSYYQNFYSILNCRSPHRQFLQKQGLINFKSINDCLAKLQSLDLKKEIRILCNGNYEPKLHQIYSLLQKYNQDAYLSLSKPLPFFDLKIFLSQNNDLRKLRGNNMKFNDLPAVYQELAQKLDITIRENMINKGFSKYINETERRFFVDIPKFEKYIVKKFFFSIEQKYKQSCFISYDKEKDNILGLERLKILFSLLLTFKSIKPKTVELIKKFVDFSKIEEFKFVTKVEDLKELEAETEKDLLVKFVEGFKIYFAFVVKCCPNLKQLLNLRILIKYYEEAIEFLSVLFRDELIGKALCTIPKKLSWDGIFVEEHQLKSPKKDVDYPSLQDIQIYNIGYNQDNRFAFDSSNRIKKIEQMLVHPLYPRQWIQFQNSKQIFAKYIHEISYREIFRKLKENYNNLKVEQKYQILNYISQIDHKHKYDAKVTPTIIEKYEAWKYQINNRLNLLFQLKHSNKQFQDEETKEFLYNLLSNPTQLKNAELIFKNNKNQLYFGTLCNKLQLKAPQKKKEQIKIQSKHANK